MSRNENVSSHINHDTPVRGQESAEYWGSDAMAAALHELGIRYVALNPGSSYRGLHDSIVNALGNRDPQIILTLHEETAVSMAHGYWKASGKMMGAAVHANVGLMHASMAIFNAWCDRAPVLVIGATGPWDAARRRPWIDWIHTAADQGALVRDYTKWDNQPGSVPAATGALLRGAQIAQTAPRGPVYINLDSTLQETKIGSLPAAPAISRHAPPPAVRPDPQTVATAAQWLSEARNPIMLAGRCTRSIDGWNARIALAEKLNLPVLTSLRTAAAFPTEHPLHVGPVAIRHAAEFEKLVASADVILSLDWVDLGGTLKHAYRNAPVAAKIIHVSCDAHNHRGWSMDYQALPPIDAYLLCEPEAAVPLLLEAATARGGRPSRAPSPKLPSRPASVLNLQAVSDALRAATEGMEISYTHLPLGWPGRLCTFRHPLDFLGPEGGGGVGAGPGITVGAALALKGSGRVPIGLLGDGDFLMGNTAVWTAVHYGIPCLMIICNNRSFYSDELHQEIVAKARDRPPENRWIGQRISEPDIDLAGMARAQGATGIGPVTSPADLQRAIEKGLDIVKGGGVCVIDARVRPG
jgi:thiamine pyrophosphate-dependent acetolactate synthase large subunit-like protein